MNIHYLKTQYHKTELPEISIIDMNLSKPGSKSWISKKVYDETISVLKNKGQVLFFLNRRGYAPTNICTQCHTSVQCKNCAVNLVYHQRIDSLVCHNCSTFYDPKQTCRMCGSEKFISLGVGLERLHEEVRRLFPGFQSYLFSSDTLRSKMTKKIVLKKAMDNEIQLLVGSQIIGKSFHFPNIKLVNIINGDSTLFSPDFRAIEKTYQLLQQVAGRSGREGIRGKVLIQTHNPDHIIFKSLNDASSNSFTKQELIRREKNKLPPFYKLATIQVLHSKNQALKDICQDIIVISRKFNLNILGPTPSLIPYKKKHFHENFYFKELNYNIIREKIEIILKNLANHKKKFMNIDIDPLSID